MSAGTALIAGGGIAGLATAIALAKSGQRTVVLERRAEFSEVGAGIQIGPNGTRVLAQLGAAERLAPSAGVPTAIDVREGRSGDILSTLPLGTWLHERHGSPYWTAHRADLHAALLDCARAEPAIEIVMGFDVANVRQMDARVSVGAVDGRALDGDCLIGADGIGSQVRTLEIGAMTFRAAGRIAARTVVPAAALPDRMMAANVNLWLAPKAHVVHYPVRGGREIAVVVVTQDEATPEGWVTEIAAASVLSRLSGFAAPLRDMLRLATDWRQWTLLAAPRLPSWCHGRAMLIGDATGPFFPFLAQGGVMALEDAVTVAKMLARHDDPAVAFRQVEAVRRPRRERMIETAARNGRIYHLDGPMALARNLTLRAMPGSRVMAGYDWLYGHRA